VNLPETVRRAEEGLDLGCARIIARNVREKNGVISLEIFLQNDADDELLLSMALYAGREPHSKPWIEMFCIYDLIKSGKHYFESSIEDELLRFFCQALGPGGKIYIEYYCDHETSSGLAMGFPVSATRQGYKLFRLGFTWFKDYYYSEGGHEGGQKLLGEKPLDEVSRRKHLKRIRAEIEAFLKGFDDFGIRGPQQEHLFRAKERAKRILSQIVKEQSSSGELSN
jgi:hypothetical protein